MLALERLPPGIIRNLALNQMDRWVRGHVAPNFSQKDNNDSARGLVDCMSLGTASTTNVHFRQLDRVLEVTLAAEHAETHLGHAVSQSTDHWRREKRCACVSPFRLIFMKRERSRHSMLQSTKHGKATTPAPPAAPTVPCVFGDGCLFWFSGRQGARPSVPIAGTTSNYP